MDYTSPTVIDKSITNNYLQDYFENSANKVILTCKSNRDYISISGVLEGEYAIGGSVQWDPFFGKVAGNALEKAKQIGDLTTTAFQGSEMQSTNKLSTRFNSFDRKSFTSSSMKEFPITFTIFALNENDNVLEKGKKILSGVYPREVGGANDLTKRVSSPNDYVVGLVKNSSFTGHWTIKIGKGTSAIRLKHMIMTDATLSISEEKLESGYPLYVKVSANFIPYQPMSYEQISSSLG
jgi:hypothetical protein